MPTVQRTLIIARPIDDVFQARTAFDNIPEWIPSIHTAYISSSGPTGIGTTCVEEFTVLGRRGRIVGTLTAYEPNRTLTSIYETGPIPGAWHYTFVPAGAQTRLHFRLEVRPGGFWSTRNPVVFPLLRRAILNNLESFRAWVEEQPTR